MSVRSHIPAKIAFASVVAFSSPAAAESVQLDMTFSGLEFAFIVDALWLDKDDAFHYDAAATSTELQNVFENSQAFGGATWNAAERSWELGTAHRPFDEVTFSMTFDIDDFDLANVVGNTGALQFQDSYSGDIEFTSKSGGAVVETGVIYSGLNTLSGDDYALFDGPLTDVVAVLGMDTLSTLGLGFAGSGLTSDWFSSVTGDNAFEYALNAAGLTGFMDYEETINSFAGDQLGRYNVFGTLDTASLTYLGTGGGGAGGGTTPVPVPMPIAMLATGLGALTLLRRKRG